MIKQIQGFIVVAQLKGVAKNMVTMYVHEMVSHFNLSNSAESLVDSVW